MFVKVGVWKNFDELEESINIHELNAMIAAIRKDTYDEHVFIAGCNGIDLAGYQENSVEERLKEVERRANEKLMGYAQSQRMEFAEFGIEFDSED